MNANNGRDDNKRPTANDEYEKQRGRKRERKQMGEKCGLLGKLINSSRTHARGTELKELGDWGKLQG